MNLEVNKIYNEDCLTGLKKLPDNCIDTCITSPPYFGLRAYGTELQIWGGDENCEHTWNDNLYIRNNDKTAGKLDRKTHV